MQHALIGGKYKYIQISQLQFTLIGGSSDILLFLLWQTFGAGNENMICFK